MLNRRALLRNSAAGAAVLLLPQATARAAALRDGRFRQGVLSGDPTPDGITLLDGSATTSRARGSVRSRWPPTGVPQGRRAQVDRDERAPQPLGQGARERAQAARAATTTASRPRRRTRRSAASRPRCRTTRNEPVRFAFFSCADYTHGYYNAYDADGARGRRLRRLPRRLHLRRELPRARAGPACATTRSARATRQPGDRPRGDLARRLPRPSTRCTARTSRCATLHAKFPMVTTLGRPRGPGQLRGRRARRRAAAPSTTRARAQGRRLQGVLRGDAVRPPGREPHLPRAALRQARRPDHARPAPVPRRPAVRRRDRPRRAPSSTSPRDVPRAPADGLRQARLRVVEGRPGR